MVNSKEFAFRLKKIMDFNEISATTMSERIGVQRSNISHILSGRNKPSLEFVMKIIKAFPEVELYWLLNGSGSYPKSEKASSPAPTKEIQTKEVPQPPLDTKSLNTSVESTTDIDRIVIFYKDGTFKNYTTK